MVRIARRPHTESVVGWTRVLAGGALTLSVATGAGCTGEEAPAAKADPRSATSASVDRAAPTLSQSTRNVRKTLKTFSGIATGAIVLVRVGDQTQVLTSGLADVDDHRAMKPDDRFPIQSLTKTMVATLVLQLVADEELALRDTVEDILPGLLPQGRRITIEHLLSHRAGLHDAGLEELPPLGRMTEDSMIAVAADSPLEFTPGASSRYSNVGYEVLGRIVEELTRQPLSAALEQNIFRPANMADSALLGRTEVQGYAGSRAVEDPYLRFFPAAGGVSSTVTDIDRFYTSLWRGRLLDRELVATMATPLGSASPFAGSYGLGVWINPEDCGDAQGHSGAGPGVSTKAWTLPDADRSVVVLVNDGDGYTVADGLASAALCP